MARATLVVDPWCSHSPAVLRAAVQVILRGASAWIVASHFCLVPGWPNPTRERSCLMSDCQRIAILNTCYGDGTSLPGSTVIHSVVYRQVLRLG